MTSDIINLLEESAVAIGHVCAGSCAYVHGDSVRIIIEIPIGDRPERYLEDARREYDEKCEDLRRKLEKGKREHIQAKSA